MKHLLLLVCLMLLSCTHSDHLAQTETESAEADRQIAQSRSRSLHEVDVVREDGDVLEWGDLETDESRDADNATLEERSDDVGNLAQRLEAVMAKGMPAEKKKFMRDIGFNPDRGNPYEFDPGPPPGSRWAELFARVPNYRRLGLEVLGGAEGRDEKFRWTFGPMFYRGRLEPNRVKVFVIGQEGAQDESVSNRSFTGGTGARMQHFLNQLGIHESYLFMNTFVYTINGQYNKHQNPMLYDFAQHEMSPIVRHRHEMFDYMLETNKKSLRLVIAVGAAARDTAATWVRSHIRRSGRSDADVEARIREVCPEVREAVATCDGSPLGVNVKVIGVPHPGGLGKGADADKLMGDFRKAYAQVILWNQEARGKWLVPDQVQRGSRPVDAPVTPPDKYMYGSAAVPFRDFSFATTWRLGRGGTSSNRKDRQASIQIFSEAGCYNAECASGKSPRLHYKKLRDTEDKVIAGRPAGDLPWEAPRSEPNAYDPGPEEIFAKMFMGFHPDYPYPNFWAMGATTHRSFGFHGPYRGRLNEAAVLVIGDQESNDDIFTGRAWTGLGGQRLQAYLAALGINRSYAILKTLPIDAWDVPSARREAMVLDQLMHKHRAAVVGLILAASKKNKVPNLVVLAVGPAAAKAADLLVQDKVISAGRLFKLPFPQRAGIAVWNEQFQAIRQAMGGFKDEGMKLRNGYAGEDMPIARIDLPIQTKWWVGASGSRGYRAVNPALSTGLKLDPNYYKIYMPKWVFDLPPARLSSEDAKGLKEFRHALEKR